MTDNKPQEFYQRALTLLKSTEALIDDVLTEPATIELCLFAGSLSAIASVLRNVRDSGVPTHGPGEEPHPLEPAR